MALDLTAQVFKISESTVEKLKESEEIIELDLVAEESLKCDQCGGPLATGSLDEVWATCGP